MSINVLKGMKVIGSAFVEFIPNRFFKKIEEISIFKREIGGSGANIAIAETRLGGKTALVTKVGDDPFGNFIVEELKGKNIDTKYVEKEAGYKTGLSFHEIDERGDSNYHFYRFPGTSRPEENIDLSGIGFSKNEAVSLTEAAIRGKLEILDYLEGTRIFYEPNIRKDFWNEKLREKTMNVAKKCYAMLPNRNELKLITKEKEIKRGAKTLLKYLSLVVVKMGKERAEIFTENERIRVEGISISPKFEIGAGDTFHGAFVVEFSKSGDLEKALRFANSAAAFRVGKGRFPGRKELEDFIHLSLR
jgi:fructokinase